MKKEKAAKMFEFLNEREGRKYPLRALLELLPEKMTEDDLENFEERLDLTELTVERLPPNMIFHGYVDLSRSALIEFPQNVKFLKGVNLSHTKITSLPDNLEIEDLDLSYTAIKKLPKNLKVNGELNLSGLRLNEITSDLRVYDFINLTGSEIKVIPANVEFCNSLDLSNSLIEELPAGLYIPKNLNISDTAISKIPNGVKVGELVAVGIPTLEFEGIIEIAKLCIGIEYFHYGNPAILENISHLVIVDVDDGQTIDVKWVEKLTDTINKLEKCDHIELWLSMTPSNFSYKGKLIVKTSHFFEPVPDYENLLDNVSIGKELMISVMYMKGLSKNISTPILTIDFVNLTIKVDEDDYVFDFKSYMESTKDYLIDFHCTEVKLLQVFYLPENMVINGNCTIESDVLDKLPENFTVYGDLSINDTDVSELPAGLIVTGKIFCENTPLFNKINGNN